MAQRVRFGPKLMEEAMAELGRRDADLAQAHRVSGTPDLRHRDPGFATLLNVIVSQQLSTASARAIHGRLVETLGMPTPDGFLALEDAALRAIGFSRQKIAYGRDLARAVGDGRLDLETLPRLEDEEAIRCITSVKGLGRWSAEMYLLFALKRPDIWPVDDLAVAAAVQRVKGLRRRPDRKRMLRLAEPWRPWRSYAARLMWHYYSNAPLVQE
ncbi:MAG TPA: DNA-3-methyladenine glycosylase 2 family protein [Alphaproteobacteria bacterium]|nr:DNA-3-methyladenine glycosylase 2 family protein [Alphaproteobacteria bacterium]